MDIINDKIIKALKTVYHYTNSYYNDKTDRHEHKIPEDIPENILDELEQMNLFPNNFETIEHDGAIERFFEIKRDKKLTEDFAKAMFYKGVSGEYVRGRQTLMSYIYLRHLPEHRFTGKTVCDVCGMPAITTIDKTLELFTDYSGHSWNEHPLSFLIELEDIINKETPLITEQDKIILDDLIKFTGFAENNETAGKLEKRIARQKILKQTDKYKRYGILQTLAECGILPNKLIVPKYDGFTTFTERMNLGRKVKGSPRSDIVLPLAGWRGEYGVDTEKYKEIFQ